MLRRQWVRSAMFFAVSVCSLPASAQTDTQPWPERQVRLVVTFPPVSGNDAAARILADGLSKRWTKPVVI